eukprot:scaffold25039_cov69-Phaeocystis_antarctica.AAC.3
MPEGCLPPQTIFAQLSLSEREKRGRSVIDPMTFLRSRETRQTAQEPSVKTQELMKAQASRPTNAR